MGPGTTPSGNGNTGGFALWMPGSGNAITNNVLLDIQRNGISLFHATGPDSVTISGNTIIGTGGGITLSGNVSGTIVHGDTVSGAGNYEWGSDSGVYFNFDAANSNVTIENNLLKSNPVGIGLDGGPSGALGAGIVIRKNSLDNTNTIGLASAWSVTGGPVNAENNWWGAATGPNGAGASTLVTTGSTGVDAVPWIVAYVDDPSKACLPGFWPLYGTIPMQTSPTTPSESRPYVDTPGDGGRRLRHATARQLRCD